MKIFLFTLAIIATVNSFAQEKPHSRFRYQRTITFFGTQTISRVEDLYYDGKASIYVTYGHDLQGIQADTILYQSNGSTITMNYTNISDKKYLIIHKDYATKAMTLNDILENGKKCIVEDSIPKLIWQLKPKKKQIGRYSCQKAVTIFRCATYTVWFTNDIPIGIGPWKLGGLPRLIIEATDERDNVEYKFSLISAEYPNTNVNYPIIPPYGVKTYQYNDFVEFQLKEIEKKRTFESAATGNTYSTEHISVSPECYEINEKK
jgi:GLPGLI family protein